MAMAKRSMVRRVYMMVVGMMALVAARRRVVPRGARTPGGAVPAGGAGRRRRGLKKAHAAAPADADAHLVTALPGLEKGALGGRQWAGLLGTGGDGGGELFYWLFEAERGSERGSDAPLIVWLNGGPGCSSMDGLFLEVGPLRVDGSGVVSVSEYGWQRAAVLNPNRFKIPST